MQGVIVKRNFPLGPLTRFKTPGGLADIFAEPSDLTSLAEFLKAAPKEIPVRALGLGSNMLIRDGRLEGITIRLSYDYFTKIEVADDIITAGAGAPGILVAKTALENSIGGFEFLSVIPGTMGGALPTNAGCFGQALSNILQSVEFIDTATGEIQILPASSLSLAYRMATLPKNSIATKLILKGAPAAAEIQAKMDDMKAKKDAAQPSYARTAGSTFKNPPDAPPAWKLIQDTGLQGARIGDAVVSPKHANFIVNEGSATAADIEGLAEKVRSAVFAKSGIMLEYEMKIIGSTNPLS
ncbi:MAG: UDP-N-acetylmuramate dehydrogenase [Rickettsiales bacterium]|jgi:UDP-N-acetylmuramate dehydrogenase|nr:UDP-N-acetylmuramate dehydrogenase [Rickettsiales bacterium]